MLPKFGFFLGKIISPIIISFIYFFVVFPTNIILRLFRKDILDTKLDTKKVKHHLYGVLSVKKYFSTGEWLILAKKKVRFIAQ